MTPEYQKEVDDTINDLRERGAPPEVIERAIEQLMLQMAVNEKYGPKVTQYVVAAAMGLVITSEAGSKTIASLVGEMVGLFASAIGLNGCGEKEADDIVKEAHKMADLIRIHMPEPTHKTIVEAPSTLQ